MAIADRNAVSSDEGVSDYKTIFESAVDGLIVSDRETGLVVQVNPAACRMLGYPGAEMIGLRVSALIHPDSRHQFNQQIRTFRPGVELDLWTRDMRQDGTSSYSRWRAGALDYGNRPCMLWSIRDVSERMQGEQMLKQRMKVRNREQSALLGISHTLASTLEFPPGLVLEQLREIIPYDRGTFVGLEDHALVTLAMRGTPQMAQSAAIRIHLQGPETLRQLFNARKPIRIADVWSDHPQAVFLRSLLKDGAGVLLEGMQSWMWVPLAVRAGILGGLGVAHQKKNFFTRHHAELATHVANQAVMMMVNAELYKNAQSDAAARERQRLAQSLHDAVNQSLFSAGLIAEVMPRVWDQDRELAQQSLEDMRRLLRGAAAEMRALLAELRPSTLTEAELGSLLRLLTDAFTGRTNIPAKVSVIGEGSLPAEVQIAVYRICQEVLNNIGKHAEASKVEVSLRQEGNIMELQIRDDGRGFDTEAKVSGHYGLSMMRERAEAVGIFLSITSLPGQGTDIRILWPKSRSEEGQWRHL